MKLKNILMVMFLMAFGVLLVACNGNTEPQITLESEFTTTVGEKGFLKPQVYGLDDFRLVYSSTDATIVEIDQSGYFRALKTGDVTLTVSLRDNTEVKKEVVVHVKPKVALKDFGPTTVVLAGEAEMLLNASQKLTATLTPASANETLVWTTSNPNVATVANDGTVLAVAYGVATITAKSPMSGVEGTLEIKVVAEGTDEVVANAAVNYLLGQLPKYVTETFTFPVHPSPAVTVEWKNSTGQVRTQYDFAASRDGSENVTVKVTYGEATVEKTIALKLVVNLNDNLFEKLPLAEAAINQYMAAVGKDITGNLLLGKYTNVAGATVTWTSNNVNVLKADGTFARPLNDTQVKLTANIGHAGANKMLTFDVVAKGYSEDQKVDYILNQGALKPFVNATTSSNMSLPLVDEKFGASLTWASQNLEVMNNEGRYVNLNLETETVVPFKVTIKYEVAGFAFERVVDINITVKPLNDIGRAVIAFQDSNLKLPQVVFGAAPQFSDQLVLGTDLPTSLEGHEGVTISWSGKEGEFNTEMKVLVPRVLYTLTEVYATFSKEGLEDAVVAVSVNIGILTGSEDEFALNARTPGYTVGQDQLLGMPAIEGGKGTAYALGFEKFYFKSTFERTVGDVKVTKTWYHFFAPGNLKVHTAEHLKDVDGKKFVDKTIVAAVLAPQWGSATRFYQNSTDTTIYIHKDDLVALGAQAASAAYLPFVLDATGKVHVVGTPAGAASPEGFTAYEIPAGGMLVAPGYLEAGVNPNLHTFGNELGRVVEVLPLSADWATYTVPPKAN